MSVCVCVFCNLMTFAFLLMLAQEHLKENLMSAAPAGGFAYKVFSPGVKCLDGSKTLNTKAGLVSLSE